MSQVVLTPLVPRRGGGDSGAGGNGPGTLQGLAGIRQGLFPLDSSSSLVSFSAVHPSRATWGKDGLSHNFGKALNSYRVGTLQHVVRAVIRLYHCLMALAFGPGDMGLDGITLRIPSIGRPFRHPPPPSVPFLVLSFRTFRFGSWTHGILSTHDTRSFPRSLRVYERSSGINLEEKALPWFGPLN